MNCGLCEYYPVYLASYNHTMQPLRRKCIYKRSDNFKVILNQFFYSGKQFVSDNVIETIRDEIHNETNTQGLQTFYQASLFMIGSIEKEIRIHIIITKESNAI